MGTNSDKHARQRENRSRVDEARRQMDKSAGRRRQLSIAAVVIVLVIIVAGIVVFTGNDDTTDTTIDTEKQESTTTNPAETTEPSAADGAAAELPAPPKGVTLTEATTCPPADGTADRVQVFDGPPPECLAPNVDYSATFNTTEGSFTAALDRAAAPKTVNNFVVLSRYQYYDGVPFHRIVSGFVIQAGDGDGEPWGNNDLGYQLADELPADSAAYTDYSLAMANSGPDTNGSQFFVILPGGGQQLQPLYSRFGQVTDGTDVVDKIGALGNANQEPTKAVVIESVDIKETPKD